MVLLLATLLLLFIYITLLLASRKPDQFQVQRQISIKATPEVLFPYFNDLHQFVRWSPFEHLDPHMQRSFNQVASGIGATYQWRGNSKAGQGSMEIVDQTPPSKVQIKLDFLKPFKASNQVSFVLSTNNQSTEVSWCMTGTTPFIGKIIHVFFDMDRIVGKDFDAGLRQLKQLVEQPGAAAN